MTDCMQFLSENRLNGSKIFGWFIFYKPKPNRISVFHTSLAVSCQCRVELWGIQNPMKPHWFTYVKSQLSVYNRIGYRFVKTDR